MKISLYSISLAVLVFYVLSPEMAYATTEYATFQAFYHESSMIGWTLAGLFAIVAGGVIFFTGGIASPIVVGIGSWVGGLMGLSGIAATNAGLALLGGGAIASGGFGMIGGVAVITAALSFSTDIVVDYTFSKAYSAYSYSQLKEESKNLLTLPIPVNESGSDSYEKTINVLADMNKNEPMSSNINQGIIKKAIKIMENKTSPDTNELLKNETLQSFLYFVSNDYNAAKNHAAIAIKYARTAKLRRTLPAFIYATSSLYDENLDYSKITSDYFQYSVMAEPDNPIIPLLFSIYLDRLSLRFNDDYLDASDALESIFKIMKLPALKDNYLQDYTLILSRYFVQLKLAQQKISFLATSSNTKLRNSSKTLAVVSKNLTEYKNLLDGSELILKEMLSLRLSDDNDRAKVSQFHSLLIQYLSDEQRLRSLVGDLKSYQSSIENGGTNNYIIIIASILVFLVAVIIFLMRKREVSHDETNA